MASMPAYDPNAFSGGIRQGMWTALREDDHLPLLNKSLQGLYPPGSTFKPVTALALLENGIAPTDAVVCRSEEHTSELQSLMRISYAVFCLKQNTSQSDHTTTQSSQTNT